MITNELQETRDAWNHIAAGYSEFVGPTHMWISNQGLDRAGVTSGTRFLDVACGSGALSIPAARRGADVLSVDLSPSMLGQLDAWAREEGLANLETRAMDGHELELEDDTFDVAGSQYGVMLFPDLPRGLRELWRVTKPDGKVVVIAYGPPSEVEFLGFFMTAMQAVVPGFEGLPADPPPLPFQAADPAVLRQRLEESGLRKVTVDTVIEKLEFETGQQMWDWVVNSNPIAVMLTADLTEEQEGAVREVLDSMLRERAGGSGPAVLTNPVNIAVGTK